MKCLSPCRSFDFQNHHLCRHAYTGRPIHSKFVSAQAKIQRREDWELLTKDIKRHLALVKYGVYAKGEHYKVTLSIVQKYLTILTCKIYSSKNSSQRGRDLPKKKLKITKENILDMWQKQKPYL